jgi:hypothetical protein
MITDMRGKGGKINQIPVSKIRRIKGEVRE